MHILFRYNNIIIILNSYYKKSTSHVESNHNKVYRRLRGGNNVEKQIKL